MASSPNVFLNMEINFIEVKVLLRKGIAGREENMRRDQIVVMGCSPSIPALRADRAYCIQDAVGLQKCIDFLLDIPGALVQERHLFVCERDFHDLFDTLIADNEGNTDSAVDIVKFSLQAQLT